MTRFHTDHPNGPDHTDGNRQADGRQVIRYAQCWEDADVLLEALQVQPGDTCLSIASAGDNTLAMLSQNPAKVMAIDTNPAQLACLELRVAAFRTLQHGEVLELMGSVASSHRDVLYRRCRPLLSSAVRNFWDGNGGTIAAGIGACGRFERYFEIFRRRVLPLVHTRRSVAELLQPKSLVDRRAFYAQRWDTWRWRLMFQCFFSRFVMSRLGRDPSFFRFAEGSIAQQILQRAEFAVTELDPASNPYLTWILLGHHGDTLPVALRAENFDRIRENLDRLSITCQSLNDWLSTAADQTIDRANLSDIFEYMSPQDFSQQLSQLSTKGRSGGRIVYWNTFVDRSRPDSLAKQLESMNELAETLHRRDQAFFYQRLVVEQFA